MGDPSMGRTAPDPHAGHDMGGRAMPPDIPTSADNPGRPPETPAPAAAMSGPAHAADLLFDPAEMAAARAVMRMENGDVRTTAVFFDQLEASFGDGADAYAWEAHGWSGGDINRFWWKFEGEGAFGGDLEEAQVQALYSRAVSPSWDVQAGVRQDFRPEAPDTTHLVLGVQGLAPHWWEIDAAAFLSTDGDLTARVEAEYDQRITGRLILQPRIEVELSAGDVPGLAIGSGLTSVEAGLRLRYEFHRELAPYVGVEWSRALGDTATYIAAAGGKTDDTRLVVGLRAWF
jgi:copper resistance protein B